MVRVTKNCEITLRICHVQSDDDTNSQSDHDKKKQFTPKLERVRNYFYIAQFS